MKTLPLSYDIFSVRSLASLERLVDVDIFSVRSLASLERLVDVYVDRRVYAKVLRSAPDCMCPICVSSTGTVAEAIKDSL